MRLSNLVASAACRRALMTVHAISDENIDCQWFTLKGELRSSTFPSYMLTVIEGAAADAG
ncbi:MULTISPECIES: hypothetical protein [Bradyrhizobium]|uniref:hypothetical protein n=1 Tax=Bradyrhizobium TaxID=374 RepID=UPI00293EE823|nr:hypothetical protein [Bradyrhizobium sp. NDS-1]WOH70748.1 hypothetical protein RX330_20865 [Bradyrhizobium sp. NDS-1]